MPRGSENGEHFTESETMSLHDRLFDEFLGELMERRKLTNLSAISEQSWQGSFFRDGSFFEICCPLKIVDYQANVALLEALPKLAGLIARAAGEQSQGSAKKVGSSPQQNELQKMQPQIAAASGLMTRLYGDLVRVKLFPFLGSSSKVMIGSAERDMFRYPPASLTSLYGAVIDANWTCVVQANKGASHAAGVIVSSTGNKLEDGFEQMVDHFTQLSTMTQGVVFPAVAVTPIAIYREVS